MTDEFPSVDEFGPGAVYWNGSALGCMMATLANLLIRFGLSVPRLADGTINLVALGKSAGARHRAIEPVLANGQVNRHGILPVTWCTRCIYLEAKARGAPVAFGKLTWAQVLAHLRVKHVVALPGRYGAFPRVSAGSYSATVPARGRSDAYVGPHAVAAYFFNGADSITLGDPDFGSPARQVIPPHSIIDEDAVRAYFLGLPAQTVCYSIIAPPPVGVIPPAPPAGGPTYRYGGGPHHRGLYRATVAARQRRSPYIRTDNIIRTVAAGTTFRSSQGTYSGTNVAGSTLWMGDATGTVWMHSSVLRPA